MKRRKKKIQIEKKNEKSRYFIIFHKHYVNYCSYR